MKTRIISFALILATLIPSAFAATTSNFSDVPSTHWAYTTINEMVNAGVINGMGDGTFAPDASVTNAQFIKMLVCQFFDAPATTNPWYTAYVNTAKSKGIIDTFSAEADINRYEMAQFMYNTLVAAGISTPSNPDHSGIADWSSVPAQYQTAVVTCYSLGLLNGMDNIGTFAGDTIMNRAQAATVINRMSKLEADTSTAVWTTSKAVDLSTLTLQNGAYYNGSSIAITSPSSSTIAATLPRQGQYLSITNDATSDTRIVSYAVLDSGERYWIGSCNPGETGTFAVPMCDHIEIRVKSGEGTTSFSSLEWVTYHTNFTLPAGAVAFNPSAHFKFRPDEDEGFYTWENNVLYMEVGDYTRCNTVSLPAGCTSITFTLLEGSVYCKAGNWFNEPGTYTVDLTSGNPYFYVGRGGSALITSIYFT